MHQESFGRTVKPDGACGAPLKLRPRKHGGIKNAGPSRRKARQEYKSGSHLLSPRRTTIGRSGLNGSVRNGKRCSPARMTTGKSGGAWRGAEYSLVNARSRLQIQDYRFQIPDTDSRTRHVGVNSGKGFEGSAASIDGVLRVIPGSDDALVFDSRLNVRGECKRVGKPRIIVVK